MTAASRIDEQMIRQLEGRIKTIASEDTPAFKLVRKDDPQTSTELEANEASSGRMLTGRGHRRDCKSRAAWD